MNRAYFGLLALILTARCAMVTTQGAMAHDPAESKIVLSCPEAYVPVCAPADEDTVELPPLKVEIVDLTPVISDTAIKKPNPEAVKKAIEAIERYEDFEEQKKAK